MKVLVCGSRDYDDWPLVCAMLDGLDDVFTVINGGATGADTLGRRWAEGENRIVETYVAQWGTHGRVAGPLRNSQMLKDGQPDMVLAFINKPLVDSKGTADMVRQAKREGIPTYVIERVA